MYVCMYVCMYLKKIDLSVDTLTHFENPDLTCVLASLQMEYCEKSTLRDTIDQGLHQDNSRLWRFFREILDGLAYIHEQVCL